MSRQNKVNKTNYDQGGRLTPDEMARERMKQASAPPKPGKSRIPKVPTGRSARTSTGSQTSTKEAK